VTKSVAKLGEVFRLSGEPTYTFVEPLKYHDIKVSLDTPGRCLVLEGPSGIGKTTTIRKAAAEIGDESQIRILNARIPRQAVAIADLLDQEDFGTVIVDDFHRLDESTKDALANKMKVLADAGDENSKLVLIGINKQGNSL
jgi:replication-associated recombination protein RarA